MNPASGSGVPMDDISYPWTSSCLSISKRCSLTSLAGSSFKSMPSNLHLLRGTRFLDPLSSAFILLPYPELQTELQTRIKTMSNFGFETTAEEAGEYYKANIAGKNGWSRGKTRDGAEDAPAPKFEGLPTRSFSTISPSWTQSRSMISSPNNRRLAQLPRRRVREGHRETLPRRTPRPRRPKQSQSGSYRKDD
jgi:hypothetical protein